MDVVEIPHAELSGLKKDSPSSTGTPQSHCLGTGKVAKRSETHVE